MFGINALIHGLHIGFHVVRNIRMNCHTIFTRYYNATVWKDLERLSCFDLQRLNLQAHHRCFEFSQNISSE